MRLVPLMTILAALAPSAAAAQGAATFDFTRAEAWRRFDWSGVEKRPEWTQVPAAQAKDQPGADYPFRRDRRAPTTVFGLPLFLELDLPRDASSPARIIGLQAEPGLVEVCTPLRDGLTALFGDPDATRHAQAPSAVLRADVAVDAAQWRAGATTVTLRCLKLIKPGGFVTLDKVTFEPSPTAAPLTPFIVVDCAPADPNLRAPWGAWPLRLTLDELNGALLEDNQTATEAPARFTAASIAFRFKGRDFQLDRITNTLTITSSGKSSSAQCKPVGAAERSE